MMPILLLAVLQSAPAQDADVGARIDAFVKGDAKAREALVKMGAPAIRPLLKARDRSPDLVEGLLAELRKAAAYPKDSPVAEALEKNLTCKFQKFDHVKAVDFLKAMGRFAVHFDGFDDKDLKAREVTVELSNATGREALDRICRQTGLDYGYFHNVLIIGKPERLWPEGKVAGAYGPPGAERQKRTEGEDQVLQSLRTMKLSLDFQEAPLADIVSYLKEFSGLDLVIEGDAGHLKLTLKERDARAVDFLSLVTQKQGLDFMLKDGKTIIGRREAIEKGVAATK